MKIVGAFIALVASAVVGSATPPCHTTGRSYYYYPAASYYAPLTYSLASGAPDQTELLRELFAAYKGKTEEHATLLKALVASGGALPPELKALAAPPHPGAVLERDSCIRCHSAEDKAAKSKGRIFFKDGVFVGNEKDLVAMRDAVEAEEMPPKEFRWTDKQRMQYMSWLTRRPPTDAAKVEAPPKLEAPKVDPPKGKTSGGLGDVVFRSVRP